MGASDKIALVTGASGFVGSHLAARLIADGWQTHLVVRDAAHPRLQRFAGKAALHVHDGTQAGMTAIVGATKPTVVFHLASLFLAQHKPEDTGALITSNVLFGTQLLQAMVDQGVKRLVNTGTAWQHFDNAAYNPTNLYAATKQAFADVAQYYVEALGVKMITLELFDTYGPDDPRPKLMALLKKLAATGERLEMSPGEQVIDLVHIEDVCAAFVLAAERLLRGEVTGAETYAVSSGAPLKLRELVAVFEGVVGKKLAIEWGKRPYRPREVMVPWRGGRMLPGWGVRVRLQEGIAGFLNYVEAGDGGKERAR